jgi:hypothetical protein
MIRPMRRHAVLAIGALVVGVTACGTDLLAPVPEPGSRQWIIGVTNQSGEEARLFLAEDAGTMGEAVGRVEPSIVPPQTEMDVVFTVPPGEGWAIFVNPGPDDGPLVLAADVPAHEVGELPFLIIVSPDGVPGVLHQDEPRPGWFGE